MPQIRTAIVTPTTAPVTSVDALTGGVVTEHCDTYTASGTWTKLSWATQITVELIGGWWRWWKGPALIRAHRLQPLVQAAAAASISASMAQHRRSRLGPL